MQTINITYQLIKYQQVIATILDLYQKVGVADAT